MLYIGIDPAIRANGLAVAILGFGGLEAFRFHGYNDFHKWTLGHEVRRVGGKQVPMFNLPCTVLVEDSNLDAHTFRKGKNMNEYAAKSRDVGKNMAVSRLIIDALKDAGAVVMTVAPSQKGPKMAMPLIKALLRQKQIGISPDEPQEDELWAMSFSIMCEIRSRTKSGASLNAR